ncbi:MAG TPA: ornithine cyclodeaminase [Thermodesulfobacteriota bacterium]|nr:ornithine cyclodeaminase [Thermodesulfobacteriota bacterium]
MASRLEFIYLSQEDVRATEMGMPQVIQIVEQVLALHDEGKVNLPSKVILDLGEKERGRINAMPAHIGGDFEICGMKWIAGFPPNPVRFGIPRAHALIILNDSWTGVPLAVMDGTYISAMRTGAVTGVGAKYLANPDSEVVGIIGCGVQAKTQIMAMKAAIPSVRFLKGYDIREEASRQFTQWVSQELGIEAVAVGSAEEAVVDSDMIATVTVANEPIVKDSWLKKGSFFAHVGSYQEEEESVIFNTDKVVVDLWQEVLHRGTPLLAKLYHAGKIRDEKIHANIGEIIRGKKPGRTNREERIFFSPLGLGSEDVAVASFVYREAKRKGLGVTLTLWDTPAIL